MSIRFRLPQLLAAGLAFVMLQAQAVTCDGEFRFHNRTVPATTPATDFRFDDANGTVTHLKTGLMWMRCSLGQTWNGTSCNGAAVEYSWVEALEAAQELNEGTGYASYTDWRIPNVKELESIVERSCSSPAINDRIFPNTPNAVFFSSTPMLIWDTWGFNFQDGLMSRADRSHLVRLVRQVD